MHKALLASAFSAAALLAQPQTIEDKDVRVVAQPALPVVAGAAGQAFATSGFTFMSAEMGFETALVKNIPFTGDFVTENVQTLGDGNRIKNSNTTSFARDGEGRTRRETTINAIGPFSDGNAHKTIFIHDPVSKTDYVLDPQNKTARKINVGVMTTKSDLTTVVRDGGNVVFNRRVEGPKDVMIERHEGPIELPRTPLPSGMTVHGQAGVMVAQRLQIADGPAASNNVKNEDLGKRIIEGVESEGTRTTYTIPAGQIGNDRALDTISERWFSNELKTIVLTTRKDPRMGESTYKLTNLRRGEPSRLLFEVPSDYKIVTEDNVGTNVIRFRVDRKQEE